MATQYLRIQATAPANRTNAKAAAVYVDSSDGYKLKYNQNGTVVTVGDSVSGMTAPANTDLNLKTTTDSKTVKLNTRDYTQATGDSIGFSSKPSQTVTTTGAVYGTQISPRLQNGVAASALVAVQGAPVTKGASAGTISADVRAFEAAIDLNDVDGTRTVTGVVSALYAFLQAPSAGTYTGGCAVIHVPLENTKKWDFLMKTATGVGFVNTTASLGAQIGQLLVSIAGTTRAIPYYATS